MSQLSNRINAIAPSATIGFSQKASELKAKGHDIIALTAGEPDFDTPDIVKQAAIQAIHDNHSHYTAVGGTDALKQSIVHKLKRDNDLDYNTNEIIASNGAKQSLYVAFSCLLNPGDEVIIPAPYWVSYPDMAQLFDAKPIIIDCPAQQQFKLNASQLEAAISAKTKLLILNSPGNPTGMIYSKQELDALAQVLEKHPDILIISDDIYEHIRWDNEKFYNIANISAALKNRSLIINGVSKAYAMTGWRIGFCAGPKNIIDAMHKAQSQLCGNPCSISQVAAQCAFNADPDDIIAPMAAIYKQRHDATLNAINAITGISCQPAQGAFYLMLDFNDYLKKQASMDSAIHDDESLAIDLLEKAGVGMVPGSAFGAKGYLRLSFATDIESLISAMNRLDSYLQNNA